MKDLYDREIQLQCITCGGVSFVMNEDKSWVKCTQCFREYNGGYDELVELNQEQIDQEFEKMKGEIGQDLQQEMREMLKKTFKGDKNFNIK